MDSLVATWRALDLRKRLALVLAAVVTIGAVLMIGQFASRPSMGLLYSGLDSATAGEVVAALEQMNVPSEVRGDAIHVPISERDRVRLALARDGLPRQGQAGYELLDGLSGFSTTTDMFSAAYWRAREGELARTILASPRVRAARVHIAVSQRQGLLRETAEPSASVTVGMAGGTLTEREAMAFRYLVALAVQGLSPEQVAVIDSRAGVILAPGDGSPLTRAGAEASAKEAKLKAEIEALLAARVGANRARVTVSLEIDRTGERVSERVLEPESRVVIHTDTEETSDSSSGTDPAVTVASNLPEGDAGGGERESNRNETRERSNYDYSEVRRERVREPGAIRKLSVAVLVDGITSTDANGNPVWQPRPAEELEALRALVRAAVGYDAERGDVVAVESMAFQPMPEEELLEAGLAERLVERNALPLVQLLVLLGVVALIVFTVLRPMLLRQPEPEGGFEVLSQIDGEEGAAALEADQASIEQSEGSLEDQLEDALFNLPDRETLRSAVLEFPDQSVATLRDWLEQEDAL